MKVAVSSAMIAAGMGCLDNPKNTPATVPAAPHSTSVQVGEAGCPTRSVNLAGWKRVDAKNAGLSLRLPPNASRADVTPAAGAGETWVAEGFTIFYRVREHQTDKEAPSPNVQNYQDCTENIGGRTAHIASYSSAFGTISPGAFAEATWPLDGDKDLTLFTQSASIPGASDTLFAVLRSVSFRER